MKEILYYGVNGKEPVKEWIESLDWTSRNRINMKISRLRLGNYGDHKRFYGIIEVRMHFGPGCRLYFGEDGDKLIVLLAGGDKGNQQTDIIMRSDSGRITMNRKYRTHDEVILEWYTKHPEEIKYYIDAALVEFQEDGDAKAFYLALSTIAKVKGGFTKLSRKTGLNRVSLYKALSSKTEPGFLTVLRVINSFGLELKVA